MTDILENTTAPLAETATQQPTAPVAQESVAIEPAADSAPSIPEGSFPIQHCLSHLEAEFEAAWASFEGDAKKVLAWLASKI